MMSPHSQAATFTQPVQGLHYPKITLKDYSVPEHLQIQGCQHAKIATSVAFDVKTGAVDDFYLWVWWLGKNLSFSLDVLVAVLL